MPASTTSLRFPLPPALRTRTLKVLTKIDGDADAAQLKAVSKHIHGLMA